MKHIYVIRHGETDYNTKAILQGWSDKPLNKNGRDLAVITGKGLSDICFDYAFSSPLIRAYETGEIILGENLAGSTKEIITDDRIKEINFGSWEGLCCKRDNFEIGDPSFWNFYDDPLGFSGGPGGESMTEVCKRTGDFLTELINDSRYEGKNVAVFTHGCAMRAMLQMFYPEGEPFWHGSTPPNCCVNIIEVTGKEPRLIADDKVYYDPSLVRDAYMQEKTRRA